MPHFKYFINRSVILQQYREALKLAYQFEDKSTRDSVLDMMKDEFAPFKKFSKAYQPSQDVQTNVDYLLAKTRQRINQIADFTDRAM